MTNPFQYRQALHLKLQKNQERIDNLEQQILAAQKLATLGTTTSLAAHEFNNILMLMVNYSEQALAQQDNVDFMRKALEKNIQHCNRASQIIQSMMGLIRLDQTDAVTIPLLDIINDCLPCMGRDLRKDNIQLILDIPETLTIHVVPGQLQQVLLNLLINARQAMAQRKGRLLIKAATLQNSSSQNNSVQIDITDNGCGIPAENLNKIFEPFYSTKTDAEKLDQRGTGLGLPICKEIIENLQGSLKVSSTPNLGTTFTLIIPNQTPSSP